jgi:hypothetical protein
MPWRCQVLRLGWISCCRSGGCTPASHQRVDEIHEELQEQLTPLGVTISRREILYLLRRIVRSYGQAVRCKTIRSGSLR